MRSSKPRRRLCQVLKWGSRPEATEINYSTEASSGNYSLQWGRRPEATEIAWSMRVKIASSTGFNGAVARRRRRYAWSAVVAPAHGSASMGPSPGGDGDAEPGPNPA